MENKKVHAFGLIDCCVCFTCNSFALLHDLLRQDLVQLQQVVSLLLLGSQFQLHRGIDLVTFALVIRRLS
jgi:hypothetical protein